MITLKWRVFTLLLCLAASGWASPPHDLKRSEIRHWGPKQGFPEETIYSIAETPDGYLWLASRDGLIRFDGLNFRTFSPGERSGFRDNGLGGALAIGESLWVGAKDYVAYAQPDAFHSFTNLTFQATALPRHKLDRFGIASMQALADGTLFFRRAEGIYRMRARANGQAPPAPALYLPAPDGETLTGFYHGDSGREWVSTQQGVYLRQGSEWMAPAGPRIPAATLFETRDGTLWAFGNDGLYSYRDGHFRMVPLPGKIAADPAHAIFEDRGGDLWVGLIGGMARIRAGKLELLPLEDTMRPGDFVKVIAQSRDGAIWAATSWGALIRVDRPVFRVFDARDGLGEASIAAVTRDETGVTWVGTRDKGVFSDTGSGFKPLPGTDLNILHAFVGIGDRNLLVANVRGLWLSGMRGSTLLAEAPSRIMNHYRAFSPNYGTHVYYDDSQVLYRIALPLPPDPAQAKLERVANVPLVRSIFEGADGLWALSWDQGLYHIDANREVSQYQLSSRRDINAFTVFELSKEYFLVGTSVGVMVFDRRGRQFVARPPLFSRDQVFQILSDDKDHVWFGARRALLAARHNTLIEYARGDRASILPFRLTSQQGLSSANFGLGTSSGSFLDAEKRIWMASVGGLIEFQPGEVVGLTEKLPCAIAEVLADGVRQPVSSSVTLAPGIRRLEIQYTVLNREADWNPVFRYRLEDRENAPWTETSLPQAGFTNLEPGNYKFTVQARLASFDWSPPVTMNLRVEPHWFERGAVRIGAVALACLALYLALRLRSRQVVERTIELEAKVQARTEELALARDAAEAAARAKANFLASMSHEIRTPMNGVIGMVEVLNQTPLNADQRRMLAVVSESSDALIAILNDILDISKIEAGALTLECAPFCLPDLIRNCHELFSPQAAAKSIALEVTPAPGIPDWVMGDSTRVRQMLLNLLSNAIKFTAHGRVGLDVRRVAGSSELISIAVSDTGIGIAAAKQESIFEVFTQAESSTTRRFGGTGLGLSICRRIAAAMHGELLVQSAEGKGSTFTLIVPLPVAPEQAAAPALFNTYTNSSEKASRRPKILVVEDNAVNRQVASRLLANLGCDVTLAHDGKQGVEAASAQRFDAILMDCHMPEMDGYEATRQILALLGKVGARERTPVIALTANAMEEDQQRCFEAGMSGFLSKPIRIDELRKLLEKLPNGATSAPVDACPGSMR